MAANQKIFQTEGGWYILGERTGMEIPYLSNGFDYTLTGEGGREVAIKACENLLEILRGKRTSE